jgi:hypothetical protein
VLTADSLAGADLSKYDVIVTGIRAYEVRHDLGAANPRLLEYVRQGGTLIVQYNKYELVEGHFTPFPITMANPHDRVTDEAAPVRVLDPASPVFTTPNRITDADWGVGAGARPVLRAHLGLRLHAAAGDGRPRRGADAWRLLIAGTARAPTSTPASPSSASSPRASPARGACSRTCWRSARKHDDSGSARV